VIRRWSNNTESLHPGIVDPLMQERLRNSDG